MTVCKLKCTNAVLTKPAVYSLYSTASVDKPLGNKLALYIEQDGRKIVPNPELELPQARICASLLTSLAELQILASAAGWSAQKNRQISSFWISDFGVFIFYERNSKIYADLFYYSALEIGASECGLGEIAVIVSHMASGLYKLTNDSVILVSEHGSYLFKPEAYMRPYAFNELITLQDLEVIECAS